MSVNPVFDAYCRLSELVSDTTLLPAWSPDGKTLGFVSGSAEERTAWRVDLATGAKAPLVEVVTLREAIRAATGVTPPGRGVPFAQFAFVGPNTIAFAVGTDQVTFDLGSGRATKAPPTPMLDAYLGIPKRGQPQVYKKSMPLVDPIDAYETLSPDGAWWLSTEAHNIAIRSSLDGRTLELTRDGTPDHEWTFDWTNPMLAMLGLATPVSTWSPNSEQVAVYRVDHRGVTRWPQTHFLKRFDETVFRHGAKAGGVLERSTLHLLSVAGAAPVEIQLGDTRDTYPIHAAWLPDSSAVVVFTMSRDCRRVDVLLADARTGATRPLFTEQGETFIRIHHDIYYGRKLGLTLTPDGRHLLWLSERDGHKHIYKLDIDGRLVGQLTAGAWPVDGVTAVSGGYVYFTAHHDPRRPYDLHLARVPLDGGAVERLTEAPGKHSAVLAPNGTVFLDTHSAPDRPHRTELRTVDGRCLNDCLLEADISKLREVGFTPPEEFSVKAADGTTDLWGVLYKPHDFDPKKTYPVIEYIYGGPQIAVVEHGFAAGMGMASEASKLAQLGCVAIMVDARGTPERSKAFHDVVYKDWATALVADHAAAIRQLGERYPFIDATRVGITGGSWGGYSSTRCLLEAPNAYRCAVSGFPGYDPFSSILYECYLGLPQDNVEAYRKANVVPLAGKLEGALMIACGTSDHFCWTDAVKMSEALIRAGKLHEFVVLPEQGHAFDSLHRGYYERKLSEFFARHLEL